jgi:hypothetical protein
MRKSSNEAPESVVRKIGMIVELLRHQRIAFSRYAAQYERDYRSFQRDLQQLRKIGVHAGFQISHIKDNEFVDLVALDKKTRNLHRGAERVERLTATIAQSLGEPIVRELAQMSAMAKKSSWAPCDCSGALSLSRQREEGRTGTRG